MHKEPVVGHVGPYIAFGPDTQQTVVGPVEWHRPVGPVIKADGPNVEQRKVDVVVRPCMLCETFYSFNDDSLSSNIFHVVSNVRRGSRLSLMVTFLVMLVTPKGMILSDAGGGGGGAGGEIIIWDEASTPCLGSDVSYLLIYVDDIILTSSSTTVLQCIIAPLHSEFIMTNLLEQAHMVNCNPSQTPVDTESKLGPEGVPVQILTLYRSLACGLHYLTFTRPDLSYDDEAEYEGVANVVDETTWLCNLLRELHSLLSSATLIYCDNVSAIYLFANLVQHQRTKHIEIGIHFVRDMVTAGQVHVLHVLSRYQYADIFTKGLPFALFEEFQSSLSVRSPPALTAGGVLVDICNRPNLVFVSLAHRD
nr:ribonuclease H-like domain-containing protein [Tanacetum cinerariifolium]